MPYTFNESANVRDYLLSINDINRPTIVDMENIEPNKLNSAVTMICRLIMLRKGTIPDQPDLGVDIEGRYRFAFDSELDELARDIEDQVVKYLPEFTPINVFCNKSTDNDKHKIEIHLIIKEIEFLLVYNIENNTIEGLKTS